jgi:hypothetical protein
LGSQLAPLHPLVVHFAIALLTVGVLFRLLGLGGTLLKSRWLAAVGAAAGLLPLLGLLAAFVAVKSGEMARADAEGVPGAAATLERHEDWAREAGLEEEPLPERGHLGRPGPAHVGRGKEPGGVLLREGAGGAPADSSGRVWRSHTSTSSDPLQPTKQPARQRPHRPTRYG